MSIPTVRHDAAAREMIRHAGIRVSDLHVHSTRSDALTRPADLVRIARERGLQIAVADHNVIQGALEAHEAAGEEGFERVVPAIEVTTVERVHLLVYFRSPGDLTSFWDEVLAPARRSHAQPTTPLDLSVRQLLRAATRWDCITSAAHPYAVVFNGVMSARSRYGLSERDLFRLTAVEVANGAENARNNARAMRLAERLGKAATAGSDAHMGSEVGAVMLATPNDEDLFLSIRRRQAVVIDATRGKLLTLLGHSAKIPFHVQRPLKRVTSVAREARRDGRWRWPR